MKHGGGGRHDYISTGKVALREGQLVIADHIQRLQPVEERMDKLRRGDIVEATEVIIRHDRRSIMLKGDRGTVEEVFQGAPDRPQVITISLSGRLPISDVVCMDHGPVRKVIK